jgi:hypothetical protein
MNSKKNEDSPFVKYLKQASKIVDKWPKWKKNCMGKVDKDE